MDAIKALTQRVSAPRLTAPAPDEQTLATIRKAAVRAADHGNLKPWRFLEVSGQGLHELGALYEAAGLAANAELNNAQRERLRGLPLRAPMVIVAIACVSEHPKVPREEQVMAAGCAVQNMLNAAFALAVGAYWRTGELARNRVLAGSLGLADSEEIVGFLYLGQVDGELRPAPVADLNAYFSRWPQ